MSFLTSVAVLSGIYLFVAYFERRPSLRFRTLSTPRRFLATDLGWYGIAILATALSVFIVRPVIVHVAPSFARDAVNRLPFEAKLLFGLVAFDLVSFLVHRALHRYDLLWNIHKIHHSSLELDGFAATRAHMVENMVRFLPGQMLLFLVGMPVTVVALSVSIAAIYGISNHSNLGIDLRWIEAVFVTPRLHRRHHVPATTQKNYGTIFTVWDRLFGSLVRADTAAHERFGVPGEIDTYPQRLPSAFRQPLLDARRQRTLRMARVR